MARYILLVNWTDQGVRNVKKTVNRAKAARKAFEARGVKMIDIHWTVGNYDLVLVLDAPDDETLSKAVLGLGMLGNVRTTTLRAFEEKEMERIVKGL